MPGEPLERYYNLKKYCINESFKRLSEYIKLENSNAHELAVKYNMQMQAKHGISIDLSESAAIIEDCRLLIKNEFMTS